MLVVIACSIWAFMDDYNPQAVKQGASEITRDSRWNGIIAGNINSRGIKLQIDGKSVASTAEQIFFDDELQLYISSEVLSEWFLCAANFYSSNHLILEKFNSRIVLTAGQKTMMCKTRAGNCQPRYYAGIIIYMCLRRSLRRACHMPIHGTLTAIQPLLPI